MKLYTLDKRKVTLAGVDWTVANYVHLRLTASKLPDLRVEVVGSGGEVFTVKVSEFDLARSFHKIARLNDVQGKAKRNG